MDLKQTLAELNKGVFRPVYFLQGEEPFYIDLISDLIEEKALPEAERSFNQTVVYGPDTDVTTVVAEARRYPMMSERMVVIVKEAQKLKGLVPGRREEDDDSAPETDAKKGPLQLYLESPTPSTVLVLCHKYKKLDTRYRAGKEMKAATEKQGVFLTFDKVRDYQMPEWIFAHAKEMGFGMDQRTSALLAEHMGNDLSRIHNEFIKLRIHMPNGGMITPDVMEHYIGISKDYNVFELTDALAGRDVTRSNRIILYFGQNQKEHPLPMVVASLFNFYFKVMLLQNLQKRGVSNDELPRRAGINPYVLRSYQTAARAYTTRKLQLVIRHLRTADAHFKGIDNVSTEADDILKELVFKLVN